MKRRRKDGFNYIHLGKHIDSSFCHLQPAVLQAECLSLVLVWALTVAKTAVVHTVEVEEEGMGL